MASTHVYYKKVILVHPCFVKFHLILHLSYTSSGIMAGSALTYLLIIHTFYSILDHRQLMQIMRLSLTLFVTVCKNIIF